MAGLAGTLNVEVRHHHYSHLRDTRALGCRWSVSQDRQSPHPPICVMTVNCVGRHKKALCSKVCDLPHSRICLVGRSINARNAGQSPKGWFHISADRRGIAAGGDPQRSLFVDRRAGDGTAHYLKLALWRSKQARLCAQFISTANVR